MHSDGPYALTTSCMIAQRSTVVWGQLSAPAVAHRRVVLVSLSKHASADGVRLANEIAMISSAVKSDCHRTNVDKQRDLGEIN